MGGGGGGVFGGVGGWGWAVFVRGGGVRQGGEGGIGAGESGGEGRMRGADGACVVRGAGRIEANIRGGDGAAHRRVDDKGRLFLAREENGGLPLRLLQVPLRRASQPGGAQGSAQDGPMLLLLIDEPSGGGGTSALSYIETLLSLLPFGLAMADRDGRILFVNKAFARAAGLKAGAKPSYPGDLVAREDQAAVADAGRRGGPGRDRGVPDRWQERNWTWRLILPRQRCYEPKSDTWCRDDHFRVVSRHSKRPCPLYLSQWTIFGGMFMSVFDPRRRH